MKGLTLKELWVIAWSRSLSENKTNFRTRVLRLLAVLLSKLLLYTSITPNMVSLLGILSVLSGAVLLGFGVLKLSLIGVLLFYLGEVFDYADGTIARVRGLVTRLQADFLGRLYHPFTYAFLFVGLGIGLYVETLNINFLLLGFFAALFQQSAIYVLELKNHLLFKHGFKNDSFSNESSGLLARLFVVPIDYLYLIILLSLLFGVIEFCLLFYFFYLWFRLLLFIFIVHNFFKKMELGL